MAKCNHLTSLAFKGLTFQVHIACFQGGETSANFGCKVRNKKKEERKNPASLINVKVKVDLYSALRLVIKSFTSKMLRYGPC